MERNVDGVEVRAVVPVALGGWNLEAPNGPCESRQLLYVTLLLGRGARRAIARAVAGLFVFCVGHLL